MGLNKVYCIVLHCIVFSTLSLKIFSIKQEESTEEQNYICLTQLWHWFKSHNFPFVDYCGKRYCSDPFTPILSREVIQQEFKHLLHIKMIHHSPSFSVIYDSQPSSLITWIHNILPPRFSAHTTNTYLYQHYLFSSRLPFTHLPWWTMQHLTPLFVKQSTSGWHMYMALIKRPTLSWSSEQP